jgi:hypothetical protein
MGLGLNESVGEGSSVVSCPYVCFTHRRSYFGQIL